MPLPNFTNNRPLALHCLLFLPFLLTACGGGGSDSDSIPDPLPMIEPECDSTSFASPDGCATFARRLDARADTPFLESGKPVSLEVVLFLPLEQGRYPVLVFHHGSTGNGTDPRLFDDTFTSKAIARHFVEQGWIVAFPQRRGRGQSEGLYDEGFKPDRSAYTCDTKPSLAGAERALEDLDAAADWLMMQDEVDSAKMLVGGTSRGGILSIAHIARRPEVYRGALNFVGGWLGEGCGDYRAVNRQLFEQGAAFPGESLWLYAANDSFYSLEYSRENFDAFSRAGGVGTFVEFDRGPGLNGHFLINSTSLWGDTVDAYLKRL